MKTRSWCPCQWLFSKGGWQSQGWRILNHGSKILVPTLVAIVKELVVVLRSSQLQFLDGVEQIKRRDLELLQLIHVCVVGGAKELCLRFAISTLRKQGSGGRGSVIVGSAILDGEIDAKPAVSVNAPSSKLPATVSASDVEVISPNSATVRSVRLEGEGGVVIAKTPSPELLAIVTACDVEATMPGSAKIRAATGVTGLGRRLRLR
ncbi:hypothetical protein Droror1_Dr00009983 [Drosera rotundifolia]